MKYSYRSKKDFVILLSFELAILSREALICHCSKSRLREHDDLWIRMDVSSIIIVRYAYVMGSNVVIKRVKYEIIHLYTIASLKLRFP